MNTGIHNYHTHTWRCQHARGMEEDYVRRALEQGFGALGFSDHTPWPYRSGYVSGMRMRLQQFEGYRQTVLHLREKYAGRIELPLGMECEAFPEYFEWLRDFKARYLDYILLGNHYDLTDEGGFYFGYCTRPDEVARYGKRTLAGLAARLYDCLAHPDLFLHTYPAFDAQCRAVSVDLCQAARDLNIPLEYNLLGLARQKSEQGRGWLGYTRPEFWQIAAENGCTAIIGYDAHDPDFLCRRDLYDRASDELHRLGVKVLDALRTSPD